MSKQKVYAVAKGHRPGIYAEWFGGNGAEIQVKGFAGARFKGFGTRAEAETWFREMSTQTSAPAHAATRVKTEKTVARKSASARSAQAGDETRPHRTAAHGAEVVIYSDGGCSKNPGPGGYGVVLLQGDDRRELSGGYALTTNNRMELIGCIKGLEALDKPRTVSIYTDSQYVVNGIEKGWAKKWRANNWLRSGNEPAENPDLWERLLNLCEHHTVRFHWVRGHAGNTENERCDVLAVEMTHSAGLPPDHGYGKKK